MKQDEKNKYTIDSFFGFRSKKKVSEFLSKKDALIKRDPLTKELERLIQTWSPPEKPTQEIVSLREELNNKWAITIFFTKGTYIDSSKGVAQLFPDSYGPLIISPGDFRKTDVLQGHRLNSDTVEVNPGIIIGLRRSTECRIFDVRGSAKSAGLAPGDVITKFEGMEIKTRGDYFNLLKKKFPGDTIQLTIRRNRELIEKQIQTMPRYFRTRNILPKDDKLIIEIDLNLVDQGEDVKFLKTNVLGLINNCIEQRKQEGRKPVLVDEPEELQFLYHCRDKTFQNYLRWYDLHMDSDCNETKGFSFRAIAFCNYVLKNQPELYEETKIEMTQRTKEVRSNKGKRTLKGFVGCPIKGEDAVEKGVKLIYKAIYRKPYPSKKTKQKEYNCPTHGISCPVDCYYKNDFMKDFNRRNMFFNPLNTLSPEVLEQVVDDYTHPKREKQKKLD